MKQYLSIFLASSVLLGCAKSDPTPAPAPAATASFATSREVVELGEAVATTNSSTNAIAYEWTTDDGQTFGTPTPSISFGYPGTHTITLKAFNKDGNTNSTSHTVTVGYRYFRLIEVLAIPFTNPAGMPWSSSGGPNLRVDFGSPSASILSYTPTTSNLTPAALPVGYTTGFSYGNPVTLTNYQIQKMVWKFTLNHIDAYSNKTAIESFTQDLSGPSANRDKAGNGWYEMTNAAGTARIRVHYETRVQ